MGDLAAAALEKPLVGKSLPTDLIQRVVRWEAKKVSKRGSLLHRWALQDRVEAFSRARQMKLSDVVDTMDAQDKYGSTPLDCAIRANSSGITQNITVSQLNPN